MKIRLLVLLVTLMCSALVKAEKLSVGWELWYPYQYHNKKLQLVGLDIESFQAIMDQAKLDYNLAEIPWKTHLHYLKVGKVDMAMGASWTQERASYAYFSKPYRKETVKLYVKKGQAKQIQLSQLADLAGSSYMLGVESGYYYGDSYQQLIQLPEFRSNISEVIDLEQNVKLLMDGHLDGFLVDPNTMQSFIKKYRFEGVFEQHPLEIYSADVSIMLSKKTTDLALLEKINQAIKVLTDSGRLQKIKDNWQQIVQSHKH